MNEYNQFVPSQKIVYCRRHNNCEGNIITKWRRKTLLCFMKLRIRDSFDFVPKASLSVHKKSGGSWEWKNFIKTASQKASYHEKCTKSSFRVVYGSEKKDFPFLHFPLLQLNLSLHPNRWEILSRRRVSWECVGSRWLVRFHGTGQQGNRNEKVFCFLRAASFPLTSTVGTEKVVLLSQFHFINSIWLINEINHCVNSKM